MKDRKFIKSCNMINIIITIIFLLYKTILLVAQPPSPQCEGDLDHGWPDLGHATLAAALFTAAPSSPLPSHATTFSFNGAVLSSLLHQHGLFASLSHCSDMACNLGIPTISFVEVSILLAYCLGVYPISRSSFWEIQVPGPLLVGVRRFSWASCLRVPL